MFEVRENEPGYALLNDPESQKVNQYGGKIDTAAAGDALYGKSLNINEDGDVGENPNRYKQHGFYFNADNCIGCHACEAACSEKNDNPAHIAFRSVGFVEGGSYPNYQRINISMACNHCDDPVCLKGCPTRAYTKFAEYGAVLQDPDICFGCGYCTWVCPYNAPQLDPVQGKVTKCNMCVDRLEVGLKPACVSACLGKALDFGVVENVPEGRTQAKTEIPGFPRTDITNPNIRFQQTRTTQRDMVRVDNMALKYHRDDDEGVFKPAVDPKHGFKRQWNWKKLLGSHESAHVAFTLSAQAVMGAFALLVIGAWANVPGLSAFTTGLPHSVLLVLMSALMAYGLFKLNMHLGKPHRFYRGFYNLRWSPVSREIAGVSLFFTGLLIYTALSFLPPYPVVVFASYVAGAVGLAGIALGGYYMYKLYRIPARPYWNHWHTGATFVGTGLVLGSGMVAVAAYLSGIAEASLKTVLLGSMLTGLALEGLGLVAHARDLGNATNEGAVSMYEQSTTYGKPYLVRNILIGAAMLCAALLLIAGTATLLLPALLALLVLPAAIIGRSLFYVLVIPTTMPGAFFWRNRGFVEHARETGLADMPQMGVVHERRHAFKVGELWETFRTTSLKEKLAQARRVFTG